MGLIPDPIAEVHAQVRLLDENNGEVDISGHSGVKIRINVGSADEFSIELPAQLLDGDWRNDMPIWQIGSVFKVEAGYDGEFNPIQTFEIVSTTVNYPDGSDGEVMTIRGVSDLARAARNRNPRTFLPSDNMLAKIDQVCADYGWINAVDSTPETTFSEPGKMAKGDAKKSGTSDLDLLKRWASEARLGGPRIDTRGTMKFLTFPKPDVGDLTFIRGSKSDWTDPSKEARRLHSLQMNRDGSDPTRVIVVGMDPETKEWVETIFESDKYGGDPKIVYTGPQKTKGIKKETSTRGLTIAVVEHRGQSEDERVDILSSGTYVTNITAEALARRYFEVREKLSRWATATVDGTHKNVPFMSFEVEGNISVMDRGSWLPVWIEHTIGNSGWISNCRIIRIVEDTAINTVE